MNEKDDFAPQEPKRYEMPDYRSGDFSDSVPPVNRPDYPYVSSQETYKQYEEPEKEDITDYLCNSTKDMNNEMLDPYVTHTRSFFGARRIRIDPTFFAKNIANIVGFIFGLALVRMFGGGSAFLYCLTALLSSFVFGTAKCRYIDKYPFKQALGMNIIFTLLLCIPILIVVIASVSG